MSHLWKCNATLLAGAVTLVLLLDCFAPALARADPDPRRFLDQFAQQATALLSDPSLSRSEREKGFTLLLDQFFDVALIGRFVIGKHWHRTSDQEQSEYHRLFERFLVAAYGRRLSAYAELDLEVGRAQVFEKTVLVDSMILRGESAPISVVWRLRRDAVGWRIIDVIVEGVSMAITQRSEFDSVIRNNSGSIRALLDRMRDVVAVNGFQAELAVGLASCCVQPRTRTLHHTDL